MAFRFPHPEILVPFKMLQGWWRNRKHPLPPFTPGAAFGGRLDLHPDNAGERPIPILRLTGRGGEIGLQHGALLKPQVQFLTERYLGIFASSREADYARAKALQKHIAPHHMEEIRGLAEGAEISFDDALLTACFLDLHKVAACSTLVVHSGSSAAPGGELMFGRTLDFPSLHAADHASVVMVYEPEGKLPFVSVGWPAFTGCISGLNTSGLAMAMMLIYGHVNRDAGIGEPFPLHYRRVMEECRDVPEARATLEQRRYASSNNMMLADRQRNACVLELHTRSVGVIDDDSDFPLLRCTNHFRTGPRKWAFAFSIGSSLMRVGKLSALKRRRQPLHASDVQDALKRVAMPLINLQRMVFYPESLELDVAIAGPGTGPRTYTRLTPELLWGAKGSGTSGV